MTPKQIEAIQAHAAKIQAAFEALQAALQAAEDDPEVPQFASKHASYMHGEVAEACSDSPWGNDLSDPDTVVDSFDDGN